MHSINSFIIFVSFIILINSVHSIHCFHFIILFIPSFYSFSSFRQASRTDPTPPTTTKEAAAPFAQRGPFEPAPSPPRGTRSPSGRCCAWRWNRPPERSGFSSVLFTGRSPLGSGKCSPRSWVPAAAAAAVGVMWGVLRALREEWALSGGGGGGGGRGGVLMWEVLFMGAAGRVGA